MSYSMETYDVKIKAKRSTMQTNEKGVGHSSVAALSKCRCFRTCIINGH
jgi:hypothetical protein